MKTFKKFLPLLVIIFAFFAGHTLVHAANPGTIPSSSACTEGASCAQLLQDSSEINFGCTNCNVQVSDSALTGYAWGENIGWINLNPSQGGVHNTTSGVLSGWAWGENTGWVNFNGAVNCDTDSNGFIDVACGGDNSTTALNNFNVSIDTSTGNFSGYAWSQNYGWINFTCPGNACVNTDWRPVVTPPPHGGGGPSQTPGSCGTDNSQTFSSGSPINLCSYSTTTPSLSGTGPWSWSCTGLNGGATAQCSAQKSVIANPPVVSLAANPTSINAGDSASLTWWASNVDYSTCVATNDDTDPSWQWSSPGYQATQSAPGIQTVSPLVTTTYTLTCQSNIDSSLASRTATVTVLGKLTPPGCPSGNCNPITPPTCPPGGCILNPILPPTCPSGNCILNPILPPACPSGNCIAPPPPIGPGNGGTGNGGTGGTGNGGTGGTGGVGPSGGVGNGGTGGTGGGVSGGVGAGGPSGGQVGVTPNGFVNGLLTPILPSQFINQVTNFFNNPAGGTSSRIISTIGLIAGASISLLSAMFVSPVTSSEIVMIPFRIWSLLLSVLGLRKERKKWGTVYDSITLQPIDPAYVVLMNDKGEEVATSITDIDGRYGFPVQPGTYTIVANKTDYQFPSKKLAGRDHDNLYKDLYFGSTITIKESGEVITKNIPMDRLNFNWNEWAKNQKNLMKFYSKRNKLIAEISSFLFGVGFTVATVALIFAPVGYNIAIFGLYVLLFILRNTNILKAKKTGSIVDKDGNPLSFAILRVYSAAVPDIEIGHSVADKFGNFYRLLPNGNYTVKIDQKTGEDTYATVFTSAPIKITKGIMDNKFIINH